MAADKSPAPVTKKVRRRRDPARLQPRTQEISQRLQQMRVRRGLSQEQVAQVVGVTQAAVSRWENPEHQAVPSAAELAVLAAHYDVTTDWLCAQAEHEQALPASQALVDRGLLRALQEARTKEDLRRIIETELEFGTVYSTIPRDAIVVTHEEARRLVREVDKHVQALDDELWQRWAKLVLSG